MKKHFKNNWFIYTYAILQLTLAFLDYFKVINWNWIYVWMPSLILGSIIVMFLILVFYVGDYYE